MPRLRSAAALISDVRSRCDQDTSNGAVAYIADSVILEWLNQAWAELYDKLVVTGEKHGVIPSGLMPVPDQFTTNVGQDLYQVPASHYKTMGVDILVGGYWYTLHRSQFERRNDYQTVTGSWAWPTSVSYDLWGQYLKMFPIPDGGYQLRHWYVPVAQRMSLNDGANGANSTIDGVNGYEVFLVDWAARKCAERDGDPDLAAMLAQDLEKEEARILTMASSRNVGEAPKMRISRGRLWGRDVPWPWPTSGTGR